MKKNKAIVIDHVVDVDSIMDDDYDDGTRFMVNAISGHTSAMSEEIDVPIICLVDDDDDDDLKTDKDYKLFFDHLTDDDNLCPLFESNASYVHCPLRYEADSGKSETRKFETFSGDSKRSKLENENPMKNRVSQQRKRETVGLKSEISWAVPLRTIRESIQRDNRVAERRKRRIAELEVARAVPLVRSQESIRRDNKVRKTSELRAETLGDAPLVRTEEDIQRDKKVSEGRKRKADELKAGTLRKAVPLVRTEEKNIQRDNRIAERRKRKFSETKAVDEASKAVPVELKSVNEASKAVPVELKAVKEASKAVPVELKAVNEASRIAQVTQRNKGVFAGRREKNKEESVMVVDKDYMSYLTWLVDSLKDFTTKPMENLQKDPSDLDPPISDTLKESTIVPEKDLLVKVKVELELESWSDDSDIIVVGDSPFFYGEGTPFVASKSVIIDLDNESKEDETSCWFRKELTDDLKRPYNEAELLQLSREVSIHRKMTRCRELRKGRETDYETDELGHSYLERFGDFNEVYKRVDGSDKAGALKLLRGFFFYLKNVSHDGAFKPWMD